jgi:hypothetical protein
VDKFNAPTDPADVLTMDKHTILVKPSLRGPLLKMHAIRVPVKLLARFNAQTSHVIVITMAD